MTSWTKRELIKVNSIGINIINNRKKFFIDNIKKYGKITFHNFGKYQDMSEEYRKIYSFLNIKDNNEHITELSVIDDDLFGKVIPMEGEHYEKLINADDIPKNRLIKIYFGYYDMLLFYHTNAMEWKFTLEDFDEVTFAPENTNFLGIAINYIRRYYEKNFPYKIGKRNYIEIDVESDKVDNIKLYFYGVENREEYYYFTPNFQPRCNLDPNDRYKILRDIFKKVLELKEEMDNGILH